MWKSKYTEREFSFYLHRRTEIHYVSKNFKKNLVQDKSCSLRGAHWWKTASKLQSSQIASLRLDIATKLQPQKETEVQMIA